MAMKVNNFPFKYMVWNIYGNNFLRSSTSYEIFNILSKSHNQYKISHISCNVNTYMYKLSQTCNNHIHVTIGRKARHYTKSEKNKSWEPWNGCESRPKLGRISFKER